jgi:hypothetical protein
VTDSSGVSRPYSRLAAAGGTDEHRQAVVGSDAFSSYQAIPDWMTANVLQTDTVLQFRLRECYKITGGYNNCVAAHEPLSFTDNIR